MTERLMENETAASPQETSQTEATTTASHTQNASFQGGVPMKRGPGRPRKYPLAANTSSYGPPRTPAPSPQPIYSTPSVYHSDPAFSTHEMQKMLLKQKVKKYAKKYFAKEQQRWQQQQQQHPPLYEDEEGDEQEEEENAYEEQGASAANTNAAYPPPGSKLAQILGYR